MRDRLKVPYIPDVVSTSGRSDVLVGVGGKITLKHFTLNKPDRIVVDITGATLGLPVDASYDGVARGGITELTYSQFSKNVVRIVVALNAPHEYTVNQDNNMVRVSVEARRTSSPARRRGRPRRLRASARPRRCRQARRAK